MSQYDFTKSPCAIDRLTKEVRDSAIVTALEHMTLLGDALSVFFRADLSEGDVTILNGIVSAHNGTPLPQNESTNVKVVQDLDTRDSDGTKLSRTKVTTTGWSYQIHGMEIETSKIGGFYSKKSDNTDFGFGAMKFYELISSVETLITGDNLNQDYLDAHCIKTVVDWEPNYDLEIMGGMMWQSSAPTDDVRFWAIGVPDVPENYGGSKTFAASINLRHVGNTESLKVDGRAAKYMTYNATYHTTKLRMIFRHPAGVKHQMHMAFELFKA